MATAFIIPRLADPNTRPSGPIGINWDSPQAVGLLAWWPMMGDLTNYFNHGRFNLTADPSPAIVGAGQPINGAAMQFNGSAVYTSERVLTSTGFPFSYTCWGLSNVSGAGPRESCAVGTSIYTSAFLRAWYNLSWGSNSGSSQISVLSKDGGGTSYARATVDFTVGRWHHAVGVWAANNSRRVYMDGANSAVNTDVRNFDSSVNRQSIGGVYHNTTTIEQPFDGRITDVRIYGKALTAAEVRAIYDPETRWDLYWQPSRQTIFDIAASFQAAWARGANSIIQPGLR